MNVKKLALSSALIVAVGIAVVAYAVGPMVAHGRGIAKNANNLPGRFSFEVGHRMVNGEPRPAGRFEFAAENPAEHARVAINLMPPPRVVHFAPERVCEFGGPARLVRKVGTNPPQVVEGRVEVRVQDKWNPGGGGTTGGGGGGTSGGTGGSAGGGGTHPKDTIVVRFFNRENNNIFTYEGRVEEGNIFVGEGQGGGGTTGGSTTGGTTGN